MATQPTPLREEDDLRGWREGIKRLWIRVFIFLNKTAALGITLLIHKGLDAAMKWILPKGWDRALELSRVLFFVIFSIIYLHFLWEMLTTFVPVVKSRPTKRNGAGDADNLEGKQGDLF
jgi:hypothetical protein